MNGYGQFTPFQVGKHGKYQTHHGESHIAPRRGFCHGSAKRELRGVVTVIQPPIAADCTLQFSLPRLIKRLNGVVVYFFQIRTHRELTNETRLVDQARHCTLALSAKAWPTRFANHHLLAFQFIFNLLVNVADMSDGIANLDRAVFPIRQDVDSDKGDCIG